MGNCLFGLIKKKKKERLLDGPSALFDISMKDISRGRLITQAASK